MTNESQRLSSKKKIENVRTHKMKIQAHPPFPPTPAMNPIPSRCERNRIRCEFELENERMKLTSKKTRESTGESSGTEEEGYTRLGDVSRVP